MKRILALLLALAMCFSLLTGCKKKSDENTEEKPEEDIGEYIEGMPNPVITYADAQEQLKATGLGLEAPEGASEVVYQSINGMAETLFTYNSVRYFYRAEPTGQLEAYDISGLNYTWTETVSTGVLTCEAQVQLCSEAGFIMWLDIVPGINYNLGTASKTSTEDLVDVAEAAFAPVQGEADGDIISGLAWDAVTFKSCEEQAAAAGFGLEAPNGASDVSYMLISGNLVQTLFTLDGVEYFYRAQASGSTKTFDISGLFYEWKNATPAEVMNREATVRTCDEAGFIMWLDIVPGINYNLGTSTRVSADQLIALAEKIFVPIQEEKPGAIIGMKNPITTFATLKEQSEYVGFGLEVPEEAKDVYYQAIGGMAQTLFTLDGVKYFFRAEQTDGSKEYDMSGLNYVWKKTVTDMINGNQAVVKTCNEAGFIMWLDSARGLNFNLGTSNKIKADSLINLANRLFDLNPGDPGKKIDGMVNPLVELDSAETQKNETGIALKAPEGAEDVIYIKIKSMPETLYTVNGVQYCYRAEATKSPVSYDISGLYYEWTDFAEGEVDGLKANVSLCSEAGFVTWLDTENGINYCLSVKGSAKADELLNEANAAFKPFGEDKPISNMKNPVVSFESAEEQGAVLGYGLKAPRGAENILYFGIGTMAETKFTLDGVDYFYRAQPTSFVEAVDISGLYCNWTSTEAGIVRDRTATVSLGDDAAFVMWLDVVPGINYNLGTASKSSAEALIALADEIFKPLQEDDPTEIIGGMENPVRSYSSADEQFNDLRFALLAPENAGNVRYQSINGMAETIFEMGGTVYYYRAEPTGALECYDMSGIYADTWGEPVPCSVLDRSGKIILAEDAGVIMWFDAESGFNYNLSTVSGADGDALLELANGIFKPLKGNNEGDEEDPEEPNVTEYASADEQEKALGLALLAPAEAENVRYQSIDGMAQTLFVLEGVAYSYRAEPTDELEYSDISGLFKEDDSFTTLEASVKELSAAIKYAGESAVIMWLDAAPGINYNLFSDAVNDTDVLLKLAEEVFLPVQSNADGE